MVAGPCVVCGTPHWAGNCPRCGYRGERRPDLILCAGSGPPTGAAAVTRTLLGTGHQLDDSLGGGVLNIRCTSLQSYTAGDLILAFTSYRDSGAVSANVPNLPDGSNMTRAVAIQQATHVSDLWYATVTATVTGQFDFDVSDVVPTTACVIVVAVRGLAAKTLDRTASAFGAAAAQRRTGLTAATSTAVEYVAGFVTTNGPFNDAAGSWSGLSAGARVGTTEDPVASGNLTIDEAYRVASVVATQQGSKSDDADRAWSGLIATFR